MPTLHYRGALSAELDDRDRLLFVWYVRDKDGIKGTVTQSRVEYPYSAAFKCWQKGVEIGETDNLDSALDLHARSIVK